MAFKSPIWQPIALVLSALNLVGVGFAAGAAEPWHAGAHAGFALAFGLWAQRMRQREALPPGSDRLDALEADLGGLRQELSETQERLDFAERLLAQVGETRRVGPDAPPAGSR